MSNDWLIVKLSKSNIVTHLESVIERGWFELVDKQLYNYKLNQVFQNKIKFFRLIYFKVFIWWWFNIWRKTIITFTCRWTEHGIECISCITKINEEYNYSNISDTKKFYSSHLKSKEKEQIVFHYIAYWCRYGITMINIWINKIYNINIKIHHHFIFNWCFH